MNEIANKWKNKYGIKFLKDIGVKKGDIVFDCCCGEGNFSILAAKIVKQDGLVYALEMDNQKLNVLQEKSDLEKLQNIKIIQMEFKIDLPLPDKSVDIILLYDIFWYFSLDNKKLRTLLDEVYRISKDDAIVSVHPEHIDRHMLKQKIEDSGFVMEKEFLKTLIHDNKIKKGYILNFRKVPK